MIHTLVCSSVGVDKICNVSYGLVWFWLRYRSKVPWAFGCCNSNNMSFFASAICVRNIEAFSC